MMLPEHIYHAAQDALRASRHEEARDLCLRLIALRPTFADGYFLLAMSEIRAGRYGAAGEALERAVQLAPRTEYLAHYAKCLVLARRDEEALCVADRAATMHTTDAITLDTLGCVYTRLGAHERALPLFRAAVGQMPNHLQMRLNLASSLAFVGGFEEAAAHYESVIAANPAMAEAHSALASLKRLGSNHVERLEAMLRTVHDSTNELHLRHALAKEYEDVKDYDAAFKHLDIAKRKRKAELGYRIEGDAVIFERLMERFGQADYFCGVSDVDASPIFIVGLPRTGTTLTDRMLSSHPDIESAGELSAMPVAVKRLSGAASRSALDPQTIDACSPISPAALGRLYLDLSIPHRRSDRRFIDKLPLNFFNVGFIARALPRAKIVCLRRHPLDTVWSNYKHLFATNFSYYNYSYDLLDTAAYYVLFDRLMRFWDALFPGRILEFRYENVVDDVEGQCRRLLEYCELEWCEACVRFYDNRSAVATPSGAQVRQPIYRSALGVWRAYEMQLAPVRDFLTSQGVAT